MKTTMAQRQQAKLQHSWLCSRMDTAVGTAVNRCQCALQGGMLGLIRLDVTGRNAGMRSPRKGVEDQSSDVRRRGNIRMGVGQAVTWSWGELEAMEEAVEMGHGKSKVSESLFGFTYSVRPFRAVRPMNPVLVMVSARL